MWNSATSQDLAGEGWLILTSEPTELVSDEGDDNPEDDKSENDSLGNVIQFSFSSTEKPNSQRWRRQQR